MDSHQVRNEGAGRRNGQYLPRVCGGCGAYVRDKHRTAKAETECRAAAFCITIEMEAPAAKGDPIGQLVAPDGKRFVGGEHALTFTDWRDALEILCAVNVLEPCTGNCECGEAQEVEG